MYSVCTCCSTYTHTSIHMYLNVYYLYTHKDIHLYIACYIIVISLYISVTREKFICVLSHQWIAISGQNPRTDTPRQLFTSSIITKNRGKKQAFSRKMHFSKNCIFQLKVHNSGIFYFLFENNIQTRKEGSSLSEIMCYTLKSLKNW